MQVNTSNDRPQPKAVCSRNIVGSFGNGSNLPPVAVKMPDGTIEQRKAVDLPSHFDMLLQTWDMAFKDTKNADFVVGQVKKRPPPRDRWCSGGPAEECPHLRVFYALSMASSPSANQSYQSVAFFRVQKYGLPSDPFFGSCLNSANQ